ncbi:MAG: hypothetical protein ACI9HY_001473 [Planctomycetaceae bacterium]|jgi:hypothetical protein
MDYQLFHLKDDRNSNSIHLLEQIRRLNLPNSWGVFPALFGLGTNELYWVVMSKETVCPLHAEAIKLISQSTLQPTVRPQVHEPRQKPGTYVFRWFEVASQHVDQVVKLSGQAWETFEDGFDTEVQGLFTVSPAMKVAQVACEMLLVTWYRDLSVWQDSRAPDPEATKRFIARQALLNSAVPIATRLVLADV